MSDGTCTPCGLTRPPLGSMLVNERGRWVRYVRCNLCSRVTEVDWHAGTDGQGVLW